MARFWRGRTAPPGMTDRRYPDQEMELSRETAVDARGATANRPTWRYRMLLLAIGSSTPDGSDVTPSDRDLLLRMDQQLMKCAATKGEDAAQQALLALVEVLKDGPDELRPQLH
jgi:hypothetical protein